LEIQILSVKVPVENVTSKNWILQKLLFDPFFVSESNAFNYQKKRVQLSSAKYIGNQHDMNRQLFRQL